MELSQILNPQILPWVWTSCSQLEWQAWGHSPRFRLSKCFFKSLGLQKISTVWESNWSQLIQSVVYCWWN
jgi:hypothetical protein